MCGWLLYLPGYLDSVLDPRLFRLSILSVFVWSVFFFLRLWIVSTLEVFFQVGLFLGCILRGCRWPDEGSCRARWSRNVSYDREIYWETKNKRKLFQRTNDLVGGLFYEWGLFWFFVFKEIKGYCSQRRRLLLFAKITETPSVGILRVGHKTRKDLKNPGQTASKCIDLSSSTISGTSNLSLFTCPYKIPGEGGGGRG